jgi:hypothetical protein
VICFLPQVQPTQPGRPRATLGAHRAPTGDPAATYNPCMDPRLKPTLDVSGGAGLLLKGFLYVAFNLQIQSKCCSLHALPC